MDANKVILMWVMVLALLMGGCAYKGWVRTDGTEVTYSNFMPDHRECFRSTQIRPGLKFIPAFGDIYGLSVVQEETRRYNECMKSKGYYKKDGRRIPPSSGTTTVVTVTWTSANFRSGAGNEFPVLMTVNKGDKLTIIGERGEWFNVRLEDGQEGWISSRAVNRQEYAPEKPITSAPTTFSSGTTKILTWDFSVVKSGPGNDYPVITTVQKGDKLTIVEQSGEWVKVRLENGQEGWIRSEVFE
jgi:uncharacterized protein YraI